MSCESQLINHCFCIFLQEFAVLDPSQDSELTVYHQLLGGHEWPTGTLTYPDMRWSSTHEKYPVANAALPAMPFHCKAHVAYVLVAEVFRTRHQDGASTWVYRLLCLPQMTCFPFFRKKQGDSRREHICHEVTFIGTCKDQFSISKDDPETQRTCL